MSALTPLPAGYAELLDEVKATVAHARWRAQRVVNTEPASARRAVPTDTELVAAVGLVTDEPGEPA
jgi:hypothetical protein